MKTVTLFGDSILYGIIVDPSNLKYVKCPDYDLRRDATEIGIDLLNISQMGRNSFEGISEVKNYLTRHPAPDYAVVEFGGNDCNRDWDAIIKGLSGDVKTPIEKFKSNLKEMITTLASHNTKVALMNMPPIVSLPFLNWVAQSEQSKRIIEAFLGDVEQIYKTHESYSTEICNLAQDLSIPLIDVRAKFGCDPTPYLCIDGVHPNPDGYRLIKNELLKYLKTL